MNTLTDIARLAPHADTVRGDRDTLLALPLNAAVHAAGHAVAHVVAGELFDHVTIRHDAAGGWTGCTNPPPGLMPRSGRWQDDAAIILGGPAAQLQLLDRITDGDRADNVNAVVDDGRDEFGDIASLDVDEARAEIQAVALIRHWWPATLRLTRAILEAPEFTLSYDECVTVLGTRITGVGTRAHQRHARAVQRAYAGGLAALCRQPGGEASPSPAGIPRAGVCRNLDLPQAA